MNSPRSQQERKKSGEFYTPQFIVDFMVNKVFSFVADQGKLISASSRTFVETLSSLTCLDPSIGTGHFVFGILRWISKNLQSYNDLVKDDMENFLKFFLRKNLFGIELNKETLEMCKYTIIDTYPFVKKDDLRNLMHGNSIISTDAFSLFKEKQIDYLHPFSWTDSFGSDALFDVIIGNPPYFNLKKVGLGDEGNKLLYLYLKHSEDWKDKFRSSSDIYYYFILKSLQHLEKEGILSFIIPNYWIDNKYADKLREELIKQRILEIIDFQQYPLFIDEGKRLNLSTCILTLQNSASSSDFETLRYSQFAKHSSSLVPGLNNLSFHRFPVSQETLGKNKWILSPNLELIQKITSGKNIRPLSFFAKVAQGVSPGVKRVFVLSNAEIAAHNIEREILVPFVTNKDITRWFTGLKDIYAIQPKQITNLDEYPHTKKFLLQHKEELMSGSDRQRLLNLGKIRWFDFSVYRNLEIFSSYKEKIICPYRSKEPIFSIDYQKFWGATDIYAIVAKRGINPHFLLGVLNSSIVKFWFCEAGKRKGKLLEFFSDPLNKIPVPLTKKQEIIAEFVKKIISLVRETRHPENSAISELEHKIDEIIAQEYGVKLDVIEDCLNQYE